LTQSQTQAIVLTACVDPTAGQFHVYRSEAGTRLGDYQAGLRFWLGVRDARIGNVVLVENSGYPLDSLREIVAEENPFRRDVEFLRAPTRSYPAHVNYGFAELDMLETVVHDSAVLASSTYFIKANGRLRFPNISRLLDRLPENYLFAVDSRRGYLHAGHDQPYVTTQLMLFSTTFYRANVLGRGATLMNETGHLEAFFYNALGPFQDTPGAILRWPINAPPVGYAAHWRKSYDSPRQRAMNLGRAVLRRVAPGVWL
jgi:hypothetical protein